MAASLFSKKNDRSEDSKRDLLKLKKTELLEIMLEQGREIDALKAEIEELRAKLESREIKINKAGSLAEASVGVTELFKEADRAVEAYIRNAKRLADEGLLPGDIGKENPELERLRALLDKVMSEDEGDSYD